MSQIEIDIPAQRIIDLEQRLARCENERQQAMLRVGELEMERDDYRYTLSRYSNPAHWHVSLPPRVECRDVWALDCAGYAPAKETLDKYATTAPA